MVAARISPRLDPSAFIAPNATIVGDVQIGFHASIWFGCVLRADLGPIVVGAGSNIQDLTVLHVDTNQPCLIGTGVTIGHRAVIHGAMIEDGALVGIGAIVLGGAVVGQGALIGAGSVVTERSVIPAGHLALGVPARVVRVLSHVEIEKQRAIAASYVAHAMAMLTPGTLP